MRKTLLILFFLVCSFFSRAQVNLLQDPLYFGEMVANTVMNTWKDSFALDGKAAKWTYDMGVILKGMDGLWQTTGNSRYYFYIERQMDFFVQNDGSIKTYKPDEYNIDHINNGKLLLTLYRVTQKEKYLKAAKLLRDQLRTHPRTSEGNFWHKKIYPYQVWLDGLYMGQPFLAEYAMLAHEDSVFDDIANQFIRIEQHTRDEKTGLLYHAWDESKQMGWANKTTGTSPLFWARAMGWFATALVDVLDYFPEQHSKRKALIDILVRLVDALEKQQSKQTGLWYDILAYSGPDRQKNYFEASASCQFTYAIAKGYRKGYLQKSKFRIFDKAFTGIINKFIRQEEGMWNLLGTVKVSGLGGNPYRNGSFDYYMSEPVIKNDPKGLGAFLLAANEVELARSNLFSKMNDRIVMMDNYFNREIKDDAFGKKIVFHYKWWERDNGGFSCLAGILQRRGYKTTTLDDAPTSENLRKASIYFLIDPDWPKENKNPNYIQQQHIDAIYNYVQNGGILVMMANDSNNVEFTHYNKLAERFGIHWNENIRHDVIDNKFDQGAIYLQNQVFGNVKAFIKQLCTQTIQPPATSVHAENGETLISIAYIGKGAVLAVGDPWFYNEYMDGRKLTADFQNYMAAEHLIKTLSSIIHKK